ncbi:MAG: polysaccharide deacetylase family protein, partial [Actinomycetota bacterium]|nr:polysaccharide deacetylase family protein [Actinomycetota bacterium]
MVLTFLLLLLFTEGLADHLTGGSGTPAPRGASVLRPDETLLGADGDRLVPRGGASGHRIALSFDDGPDPRWTPRIAQALLRLHVPATFFVVGDHVIRHPGIVDDLVRDGFEVGNHTFTHSDLADLPSWQRNLQVSLTESAVAGAAGVRPRFLRPPYSATPDAVTASDETAYAAIARRGYLIA